MEGREFGRSMTLSEQLAVEDSPNPPTAATGAAKKREAFTAGSGSQRTLMDIIKEEHDASGAADATINWKSLKERLRLRLAGSRAAPGHPCPISDPEVAVSIRPNPADTLGRSISRSFSVRNAEIPFQGSASRRRAIVSEYKTPAFTRGTEEEEDPPASGSGGGAAEEGDGCEGSNRSGAGESSSAAEEQPVRISLMALLEQTDRWGGEAEAADDDDEEEEEDVVAEDDDDGEGDGGGMYYACCVCMVRHKGAAFIPCGHTFCRLCSRELWVSRGNCPLCNGFILEILDIF